MSKLRLDVAGDGAVLAEAAETAWAVALAAGRVVRDEVDGKPALIMERER